MPYEFFQCRVQTASAKVGSLRAPTIQRWLDGPFRRTVPAVHRSLWRRWKAPPCGVNEAPAYGAVENGVQNISRERRTVLADNRSRFPFDFGVEHRRRVIPVAADAELETIDDAFAMPA
jgi:hypothetical protein